MLVIYRSLATAVAHKTEHDDAHCKRKELYHRQRNQGNKFQVRAAVGHKEDSLLLEEAKGHFVMLSVKRPPQQRHAGGKRSQSERTTTSFILDCFFIIFYYSLLANLFHRLPGE